MSHDDFRAGELTIPPPRRSTLPRGRYSSAKQAPARSVRITDEEYDTVTKAAALCDMTWAEFVRWCTFHGAMDVNKQHKMHGFK